jgi:hypothetical protein
VAGRKERGRMHQHPTVPCKINYYLGINVVRDARMFNTPIDEPDRPLPRVFDPFLQRRGRAAAGSRKLRRSG